MSSAPATKRQTAINGINVEAANALIEAVQKNPREGLTHWKVNSAWQNATHMRSKIESFRIGGKTVNRTFAIDIDEPVELGGGNAHANPQEHLIAALNSCMMVGYVEICALQGIALEKLEIETEGDIDLRGLFALNGDVPAGYKSLSFKVRIKGDGTKEQFAKIHEMVMATSPNFYNISRPVTLKPTLLIE